MKKLLKAFILMSLLLPYLGNTVYAQTDYTVHANIIYRFTKYIDWPEDKKSGDFIIGVLGDSPVYYELKKLTAKKNVGNQKIVIVNFTSSKNIYNCQILFIGEDESDLLKKIVSTEPNSAVLIITEEQGLCKKGSCINLISEDDKLKLEINKNNIEKRNLKIATELLSLGTIIK